MDIQRLRNLTTDRLHTDISHVYLDLEAITGQSLFTHMLPRANRAVQPWLQMHLTDERFWDGEWDKTHTGEIDLPEPTEDDRKEMCARFEAQPDPLRGKHVIGIKL